MTTTQDNDDEYDKFKAIVDSSWPQAKYNKYDLCVTWVTLILKAANNKKLACMTTNKLMQKCRLMLGERFKNNVQNSKCLKTCQNPD